LDPAVNITRVLITKQSKNVMVLALALSEAEFQALSRRQFLDHFGLLQQIVRPVTNPILKQY
jgi:hypothetical protein